MVFDKINNLIKDEDDLSNLDNLISEITKEKSTIDSQLKLEQERHLQQIDSMINKMQDANKNLQDLKYSINKLEELRKENNKNDKNDSYFQIFDQSALIMKNINSVEDMFNNINSFNDKIYSINLLLDGELMKDEDDQLANSSGDNLLVIHYELNKLRDLQDQMNLMSDKSSSNETKMLVDKLKIKLNKCIEKFDSILYIIIDSILDIISINNYGFLIKLIKIIQFEEREDLKVRLWNHLINKNNDNSMNNSNNNNNNKEDSKFSKIKRLNERSYKEKFEERFEQCIENTLNKCDLEFFIGEEKMYYYQTLLDYQTAINKCFPEEWNFFPKILEWHQNAVRNIVNDILAKDEYSTQILSDIFVLDYENKKTLKDMFKINNNLLKDLRILPIDKKKELLDNALKPKKEATSKWIENALDKSITQFESLSEEPSGDRNSTLQFQMARNIMNILSSNTKDIRILGDATVLVQYFSFFANEILPKFQEIWTESLDKMCDRYFNKDIDNINFLPRYITSLVNDLLSLTDALERDFDLIISGLSEIHSKKLIELKEIAISHTDELGSNCLHKLSLLALSDFGPIMDGIFDRSWYKSSTIIESTLNTIIEGYLVPFIHYSDNDLVPSLVDFLSDQLLLKYLDTLNFKRPFDNNKACSCLERDYEKILNELGQYDPDLLTFKLTILQILIELIKIDNNDENSSIEGWNNALSEFYDLPIDLLKIILENKKVEKSKISYILVECTKLCKQSMSENIGQSANIFRKFHYTPKRG